MVRRRVRSFLLLIVLLLVHGAALVRSLVDLPGRVVGYLGKTFAEDYLQIYPGNPVNVRGTIRVHLK